MGPRWRWLIGFAAALALVASGCGGSTNTSSSGTGGGAEVVPASAPIFVAIDNDLSSNQWKAVDKLADKFPGKAKFLTYIRTELQKNGLDWENDVKPALGKESDVAVLDFKPAGDFVGLTQPADEEKFAALVKKLKEKDPTTKFVYEKVGDWTVFSDTQAKIDLYKQQLSGPKLADDSTFKNAMSKLSDEALVKAYVNGAKVTSAVRKAFAQVATAMQQNQGKLVSAVAELVAEDDGLRADAKFTTEGVKNQGKPYKAALLDEVPAGVLAYLSFNGESFATSDMRKQFEQGFLGSGAGAIPQLRQLLPVFEQLGAVFAHESAIYVRPGSPIPEVTVVATPDTPAKGEAAIDKLIVKLAAMAGAPLRPKPITIGGTQAKELNLGRISIFYGAQGDKLVITNQQQAFQDLEGSGPKLASDATFKEAQKASSMPAETNGFLYLNLKDAIPLIESLAQLGGEQIPPDVSANLKPLRTFVAWAKNDGGTGSAALFLEIQ